VKPPNARGRAAPAREQGKPDVPKREVPINPINPRGELVCSVYPWMKIKRISLVIRSLDAAFSGIDRN